MMQMRTPGVCCELLIQMTVTVLVIHEWKCWLCERVVHSSLVGDSSATFGGPIRRGRLWESKLVDPWAYRDVQVVPLRPRRPRSVTLSLTYRFGLVRVDSFKGVS